MRDPSKTIALLCICQSPAPPHFHSNQVVSFFAHTVSCAGGAAESALGKNLTYLNRYSASRMCLAMILAGGHAFNVYTFSVSFAVLFERVSATFCVLFKRRSARIKPLRRCPRVIELAVVACDS
jgi:hypothetical protein